MSPFRGPSEAEGKKSFRARPACLTSFSPPNKSMLIHFPNTAFSVEQITSRGISSGNIKENYTQGGGTNGGGGNGREGREIKNNSK